VLIGISARACTSLLILALSLILDIRKALHYNKQIKKKNAVSSLKIYYYGNTCTA